MGILKSLHLVEEVNNDVPLESDDFITEECENADVVVPENVPADSLISDIYESNNLSDMSRSIFKVEEIMKSLPNEMPTDNKRKSVLSILSSFDLMGSEVYNDGIQRVDFLSSAEAQITQKSSDEIIDMENEVESLKEQIQELEKKIASSKEMSKKSAEIIQAEKERIVEILDFIAEGE